jgi:uncharacterized protein with GYD domain
MPTYIALSNFTEQGLRNVKDTTKRADAVKESAKKLNVEITQIFWTLGHHDVVVILDAPDDAAATAFALATGAAGNVKTQTLRAFSKQEMDGILRNLKRLDAMAVERSSAARHCKPKACYAFAPTW